MVSVRIRNQVADQFPPAGADSLTQAFVEAATRWIERALDIEDVVLANKLSMMFGLKNKDLQLLELLLHVVEDVAPVDQLQSRCSISI